MERFGSRKWMKGCALLIVLVLPLFVGGCGSSKNSPIFNIAGQWYMYVATNGIAGEQGPGLFLFYTSDTTLSGTTSQGSGFTGTTTDTGVSFSWVGSDGATYTYDGTVGTNGGTMQGTWSNTSKQSGTWIGLINNAPSVTIPTGSWVLTTSGAQGTMDVSFVQSVNSVSITTPKGIQNPPGTISLFNIVFFVAGTDGSTYTYNGTVTSATASMSGSWTSTNGQSGTWSATKS